MAAMKYLEYGGSLAGLRCRTFSLHRPTKDLHVLGSNLTETPETRPIRIVIGKTRSEKLHSTNSKGLLIVAPPPCASTLLIYHIQLPVDNQQHPVIHHSKITMFLSLDDRHEAAICQINARAIAQNTESGTLVGLVRNLLLRLGCVRLGSEISSGGAGLGEEAREDRVDKGSEQDLSTRCLRKSHPEDKDELEGVVECCDWSIQFSRTLNRGPHTEPIDSIDHAFDDCQEGIDDPILTGRQLVM
jgi:hypothetical protein